MVQTMKRTLPLVAIAVVLLFGCRSNQSSNRIVYGLTLAPSGIDPHIHASSELGIPLTSVYDTLVVQDPETGEFVAGLAERWEISPDGTAVTFYLREDVTFHDGTPFNAEAVRVNLERVTSDEIASLKARFMLGPYERTDVLDEYIVQITLSAPYAPLLDSLSQVYLGMASPAALERWGSDYQLHQVGSGPYVFAEYVPGDHLLLKRNPDYAWAPALTTQEQAQVEEIEFRFYTDPATRSPALETGEVHIMGEIPPQDAARLAQSSAFRIEAVPIPGVSLMLFMNTQRPPLDELAVRQALLYAADRQTIVATVFQGSSPVAYGPLAAVNFGYDPAVQETYLYSAERAAALLDEAGWSDHDGDGTRDRDGQPLTLDMYLMGWGYMPEVGQLLEAQWADLGIDVNSQVVSYPEALELAGDGRHHIVPFNLSGSDPDILRNFFHSEASFNWSKADDAELDAWLEAAARTYDRDERAALYSQAQRRIMEQALVIPVRDYVNLNGVSAHVQGLRYNAQGWFPWLIDVTLAR